MNAKQHKMSSLFAPFSLTMLILSVAVPIFVGAGEYSLKATLVEHEKMAQESAATVKVDVKGVKLVDAGKAEQQPRKGQGHLHYRLDDGPVIATTATTLSFHELSPGNHKIVVMLAGNDHQPLGPQQTIAMKIGERSAANSPQPLSARSQ